MSKVAQNKKYLALDGVRISYRPKDDSIQITSSDEDLAGENFHLTLKKNTESEQILRDLLMEKGLILEDKRLGNTNLIPTSLYGPEDVISNQWNTIALGEKARNEKVFWDVSHAPHALVVGATGSGKSVLQRAIFNHCLVHNWDFYGIDVKRVELSYTKVYTDTTKEIASTVEDGVNILENIFNIIQERYRLMEDKGAVTREDLNDPQIKPIMLMVDEAYLFLGNVDSRTDEGAYYTALKRKAAELLARITSLGRAAGVHVALATNRPDAAVIKGKLKSNLDIRIAAGRLDSTPSMLLLDSDAATMLSGDIKGRAIIRQPNRIDEFQFYFYQEEWADEWVLSQNGSTEKERYTVLTEAAYK